MQYTKFNWFIKSFIYACIFFIVIPTFAETTKEQATSIVLSSTQAVTKKIDVYVANELIKRNGYIKLIDRTRVRSPYSESWAFFVDDNPFTGWYHGCRIIFVNTENGELTAYNNEIFPSNLSSGFEIASLAPRPIPSDLPENIPPTPSTGVRSNYNYAMIICTLDDQAYWNDVSLIYNTLINKYNYDKQNIFVHYNWNGTSSLPNGNDLDGKDVPSNDIKYEASWSGIFKTLKNLSGQENNDPDVPQLEPGDQLAIFFTGTPAHKTESATTLGLWNTRRSESYIQKRELDATAQIVNEIECSQMTILFAVNFAESIAENFSRSDESTIKCENRYLFRSTGSTELSHKELWITGGNYSEFVFYWASAARGSYPDPKINEPWKEWISSGSFPFRAINGFNTHPEDYDPDSNKDGFVQINEALTYARNMDTWSNDGFYFNQYDTNQGEETSGETNLFPFTENLISLAGLCGEISQSRVVPARSYIFSDKLIISKNTSITFSDNSQIFLHRNLNPNTNGYAYIYCQEASDLHFGINNSIINKNESANSTYLEFHGNEILVGASSEFVKVDLYAAPSSGRLSLDQVRFNSCLLNSYKCNVEISNCGFDNVFQYHLSKDLEITTSNFFESSAWMLSAKQDNYFVKVNNCTFDGICPFLAWNIPLNFHYYGSYDISGNNLQNNDYGISVNNMGWGDSIHRVTNNEIFNQNKRGLVFYLSRADVEGNNIHDNGWSGLVLNNHCNINLEGNRNALAVNQTQRIMNNKRYELLTDESSFPAYIKWNAIIDEDNSLYELLYCQNPSGINKDVSDNYWGSNFEPRVDLYPPREYTYLPKFNLGDKEDVADEVSNMYLNAKDLTTQNKYILAKAAFRNLIRLHPESRFAAASLKELFVVEGYSTNNYSFLKHYYTTDGKVQNNPTLKKTGEFLANRCDLKLGYWSEVISWHEDIILNPVSQTDSIYAIIDLGNVYLLKEQSDDQSTINPDLPQYKPTSFIDHVNYSIYLQAIIQENKINEP